MEHQLKKQRILPSTDDGNISGSGVDGGLADDTTKDIQDSSTLYYSRDSPIVYPTTERVLPSEREFGTDWKQKISQTGI